MHVLIGGNSPFYICLFVSLNRYIPKHTITNTGTKTFQKFSVLLSLTTGVDVLHHLPSYAICRVAQSAELHNLPSCAICRSPVCAARLHNLAIFDYFGQLSDSFTLCTKLFDVGAPVDIFIYIGFSLSLVFTFFGSSLTLDFHLHRFFIHPSHCWRNIL